MSNAAHKHYKQNQINTASNEKLLIMLYQGCIKFLRLAKKGIEEDDMEMTNKYLIKSQDIINELRYTLDFERGGDVAKNLKSLYDFMYSQLIDANIKKEKEPITTVEEMMLDLLESWQQIIEQPNGTNQNKSVNLNG